jgi:hypothetical protein
VALRRVRGQRDEHDHARFLGWGGTGHFANTPTFAPGRFASAFNGPLAAEPMTVSGTSGNASWALEPGGAVSLTAWVKYNGNPGLLKYIASKGDFRYVPTEPTARAARTRSTRATALAPA